MIGDKILIQKQHKIKAKNLLPEILKRYKKNYKMVIAIGGESGSGKSEVVLILRNLLYKEGIRVQIVPLDNYYKTCWTERNKIRQKQGINSVGRYEIMWSWIWNIINRFRENYDGGKLRQINKFTDSVEFVTFDNRSVDILIVEGLYACYLDKYADLKIYLEGTYHETKAFRLERKKEEQTEFRELVLEREHQEVEGSKQYADIKVSFEGELKK